MNPKQRRIRKNRNANRSRILRKRGPFSILLRLVALFEVNKFISFILKLFQLKRMSVIRIDNVLEKGVLSHRRRDLFDQMIDYRDDNALTRVSQIYVRTHLFCCGNLGLRYDEANAMGIKSVTFHPRLCFGARISSNNNGFAVVERFYH